MKWYKHISDSLDDPFIFELMEEFGSDAYLTFFGILEIYSREFSTESGWKLTIKLSYFHKKLLISSSKIKKILSKIYKWEITYTGEYITIYIPKFKDLLDEWTLRNLNKKEKNSGVNRELIGLKDTDTDTEEDKERDNNIIVPLEDGTDYQLTTATFNELQTLYPTIDIKQELRNIRAWNIADPRRRKTRAGIMRHITTWMRNASERQGKPSRGEGAVI